MVAFRLALARRDAARDESCPHAAPATAEEATKDSLCRYLDIPAFRGTPLRSAVVLLQAAGGMASWWVLATWTADRLAASSSIGPCVCLALRAALAVLWAGLNLRSFMIFHDCGHGSFFQGSKRMRMANWLTLHVSAAMCATPPDWNLGHQLHHANVGNLGQDDYDWGETVFHTSSQFVAMPAWKQQLWRVLRHPLPFFSLAGALTWYFKMRLPFELRPGRKAAYRFTDKLLSALLVFGVRYPAAHACGIFSLVLLGDYLAMTMGVLLFHWQHVYDHGYVRGSAEWKLREAAMHGSSLAVVPTWLKYFTLGIEYHHIHHFRMRIPGYMLREVHEGAPSGAFDDVTVLDAKGMWRSLHLQVWDEATQRYATFDEVLKRSEAAKAA